MTLPATCLLLLLLLPATCFRPSPAVAPYSLAPGKAPPPSLAGAPPNSGRGREPPVMQEGEVRCVAVVDKQRLKKEEVGI